ncbi:MAG: hypothetical protein FWG66_06560 [Spirochaetes bacterium]|nr:hypothetical protein [Spirochaetota bacterium]
MAGKIKIAAAAFLLVLPGAVYAEGGGLRNHLDGLGLSAGSPPLAALEGFGFGGYARFEGIRDAGGGGFAGWAFVEEPWGDFFVMAWTDRGSAEASAILFAAQGIFGTAEGGRYEAGFYFTQGGGWDFSWNPEPGEWGGYYFPAGTALFWIYADNN